MSRPIEQALLSLMPGQANVLPPQLLQLAESLLAQSRHKASTLKADEDVARLYACAHLACDRMKITLDLPPIEPRPPIPPRNYKRLYDYLEKTLPGTSTTPKRAPSSRTRTPSSKTQADTLDTQDRPLPSRGAPSIDSSLSQFRTDPEAKQNKATRSSSRRSALAEASLRPWVKPVTRFLCVETGNAKLSPTVIAAMEAIMLPAGLRTEDKWVSDNPLALLAAVYFFVKMRLVAIKFGTEVDAAKYAPLRKEILDLLERARAEVQVKENDDASGWEGWTSLQPTDFDDAVGRVTTSDWLDSDWYRGITDIVASENHGNDTAMDEEDASGLNVVGQIKRTDSMFQPEFDYLSDERRADYVVWKEAIMNKMSQGDATGAMELDTA